MTSVAGYVTFDQVDSELETNLGGEFTDFEFIASGELDDPQTDIARSEGVAIGGFQGCDFIGSNGSLHRQFCLNDRIIKVQRYISSNWVTVLEVEFLEATSIGFLANVITANVDIPVLVKARG